MTEFLRTTALALVLAGGTTLAHAQNQPSPPSPKNQPNPQTPPQSQSQRAQDAPTSQSAQHPNREAEAERAQQSTSGKAGKEEPGSHAPTEPPDKTPVLVDGRLTAPGSPQQSDTVPSTVSPQNAADDKLITTAYTFKTMPNDQRQAIYQALKNGPSVGTVKADVGTELPVKVALQVIPEQLARQVPQTKGYHYAVSGNRVLLVAPANRIVVAVFQVDAGVTTGKGDRVR